MANHGRSSRGFALPTILLASTLMMIVLVVAVSALASINVSMQSQYMDQLAREAAESGLARAADCVHQNSGVAQWGGSSTPNLYPTSGCGGAAATFGQSCDPTTNPSLFSLNNLIYTGSCNLVGSGSTNARIYSTFTVLPPSTSGAVTILTAKGTSGQLRSDGSPIASATHTVTLSQRIGLNLNGIASGNDTTCSIQNGQLYCWGKNDTGQVGNGTSGDPVTVPYHVQGALAGKYVQYVATGISHTCAVAGTTPNWSDGNQVYCWGDNSLGQLGTNNTTSSLVPVQGAYGLAAGRAVGCNAATPDCIPISTRDHSCIIAQPANGSGFASAVEYCWGNDQYGQAGQVSSDQTTIPPGGIKTGVGVSIQKQGGAGIYYITSIGNTSGEFACLINGTALGQTSGGLYCWGHNYYGELGNGTRSSTATQMYATPVNNLTSNVTKVTTNNGRACAIQSANLYCWGENGVSSTVTDYRLDSGAAAAGSWYVPTPIKLVSSGQYGGSVADFALTDWDTCIVVTGKVWCSGYNDVGQLGQGTTGSYNAGANTDTGAVVAHGAATSASQVRPASNMVQVKGALTGQTVVDITSGNNHFCAITAGHEAYCWGDNSLGQLGNGTTDNSSQPTKTHIPATIIY